MPRSNCDFCCNPIELARNLDSYRAAVLQILCQIAGGTEGVAFTSVAPNSSLMYAGTEEVVPQFGTIQVASSGPNLIHAAVPGKKIRVLNYVVSANGLVNAKFQSAGNDKTGLIYLAAAGAGVSAAYSPIGLFETNVGEALNLNLSAGTAVGGHYSYLVV